MSVLPASVALSDPPMRPGLADRLVRAFRLWRARHDPSSHDSLAQYREAPVGVDASDPEAELCVECLSYPATWQGRCFTCNARQMIAKRRGIA